MSISKEQLSAINGLMLSGIINKMDNQQFSDYCKTLFNFIENFPVHETELKAIFSSGDYDSFTNHLLIVRSMLEKIYATGLLQSCNRLMNELKTQKYLIVEAHLTYFLAEVSELSIEIQMARQNQSGNETHEEKTYIAKTTTSETNNVSKSILAVDDVSLILNSLRLTLKDTEYKLTAVKSGLEALRFINTNNPDLFILDIEMPEMNGYELAEKIRRSGQTAPIIFLTGNAKEDFVIKAIKAGAADFIVKPFNNENILKKIKKRIG